MERTRGHPICPPDARCGQPASGCGPSADSEGAQTMGDTGTTTTPRRKELCQMESAGYDSPEPDSTCCRVKESRCRQDCEECESSGRCHLLDLAGSALVEPCRPPDSGGPDSTSSNEPRRPPDTGSDSAEYDPDEPRRPLDSDCCGSGCSPCVFDLYDRDLTAWRRRREQREQRRSAAPATAAVVATDRTLLRPDQFTALSLASISSVTDSSAVYRFVLPTGASLHVPFGAHLRLRVTDDTTGRVITRAYTPVCTSEGFFDVYVRLYAAGAMSSCVRRWQPGQRALWSGPFGGYRTRPGDARLVLLAAGTGVAPFVRLVRAAVQDEESDTRLTLLLSVRCLRDVYPRRELTSWASYWNFTYQLFVSGAREAEEAAEEIWYGEPVRWRRLQREDVQLLVRQPVGRTHYLVCGTLSFEKDVLNYLRDAGVADEDVLRF